MAATLSVPSTEQCLKDSSHLLGTTPLVAGRSGVSKMKMVPKIKVSGLTQKSNLF